MCGAGESLHACSGMTFWRIEADDVYQLTPCAELKIFVDAYSGVVGCGW